MSFRFWEGRTRDEYSHDEVKLALNSIDDLTRHFPAIGYDTSTWEGQRRFREKFGSLPFETQSAIQKAVVDKIFKYVRERIDNRLEKEVSADDLISQRERAAEANAAAIREGLQELRDCADLIRASLVDAGRAATADAVLNRISDRIKSKAIFDSLDDPLAAREAE